jgi:protease I
MPSNLKGKRIAILATDGFEQVELTEPRRALDEAGATTEVISPKSGKIKGWNHTEWGESVAVDRPLDQARVSDYDALMLPGGVMNPDRLRMDRSGRSGFRAAIRRHRPARGRHLSRTLDAY